MPQCSLKASPGFPPCLENRWSAVRVCMYVRMCACVVWHLSLTWHFQYGNQCLGAASTLSHKNAILVDLGVAASLVNLCAVCECVCVSVFVCVCACLLFPCTCVQIKAVKNTDQELTPELHPDKNTDICWPNASDEQSLVIKFNVNLFWLHLIAVTITSSNWTSAHKKVSALMPFV